jgi:hypothetical protein
MDNLYIYNKVRSVPKEAKKEIKGGRLSGKTDINPMWRIKTLTEQFGPCGVGWKAHIKRVWLETGAAGEIAAFCEIDLYIKVDEKWSEPISGIGGSMFIANEKNGPYTSDECYKMAYTDAISVACKMLGIGADVYWEADSTKYSKSESSPTPNIKPKDQAPTHQQQLLELINSSKGKITGIMIAETIERKFGKRKANDLNLEQFKALVKDLQEQAK